MRDRQSAMILGICAYWMMALASSTNSFAGKKSFVFGGGPAGGTFQTVAEAIQDYRPVREIQGFSIQAEASAGSVENLRKVNGGQQDFATVYSRHVYLGREGRMKGDRKKYQNVLPLAYLYGAPAQLVTRTGSGIKSVMGLVGKKVGVGNPGSGALAICERFFTHMGVWNKIERKAVGYNDAAAAFGNNQLDAFWVFTAVPSDAVVMAAQTNAIELVDLGADAERSGFYDTHPYFSKLTIPAGTYKGVDQDTPSFQDSALWVANAGVPDEVVYTLLSLIYTDEGLAHMRNRKRTFQGMTIETGVDGIATPMHPGAIKFWAEKGVLMLK